MKRVLFALVWLAAGCSDGATNNDMSIDAGMDLAPPAPDMVFTPTLNGTKLIDGNMATVLDTTADDFAIVKGSTGAMAPLEAHPLTGGAVQTIDAAYQKHVTQGKVVFSWSAVDANSLAGTLVAWTSAGGAHPLSTSSTSYAASSSPDGQFAIFADNATSDGLAFDLKVGKTDGSISAATSLTNRSADTMSCPAVFQFVASKWFVASCATDADAGVSNATIDSVDPTTGVTTSVATNVGMMSGFSLDSAGTHLFYIDALGKGQLLTLGSGTVAVDAAETITSGFLVPDGSAVIYATAAGALKKATLGGGAPTLSTLVATNANQILATAPNNQLVLYSSSYDSNNGGDLSLVQLTGTPAPVSLVATGFIYGDAFTADSSFALYFDNPAANLTADLHAHPTGAGAAQTIATGVWNEGALMGAKIVYNDDFVSTGKNTGRADLKWVDVAAGGAPTLIATQAELDFIVSQSKKYVIYRFLAIKGQEATYLYPVP
jgi:hypothetical protein